MGTPRTEHQEAEHVEEQMPEPSVHEQVSDWVNIYVKTPKESMCVHHSTYKDVPQEWLGRDFIEEAEHLREVNPDAADIRDLIHLKKMYAGIIEKTDAGDINGDGNLDATDLAELKKILLLK